MSQPISNGNPRQVCDGINNKRAVTENAFQETAEIQQRRQSLTIDFEESDPGNPLNWPGSKKWTITLVFSLAVFLRPLSSSIVAPELRTLKRRTAHGQLTRSSPGPLNLRPDLLSWPFDTRPIERDIWKSRILALGKFILPDLQPGVWVRSK